MSQEKAPPINFSSSFFSLDLGVLFEIGEEEEEEEEEEEGIQHFFSPSLQKRQWSIYYWTPPTHDTTRGDEQAVFFILGVL